MFLGPMGALLKLMFYISHVKEFLFLKTRIMLDTFLGVKTIKTGQ
jgi:hypothetical protein